MPLSFQLPPHEHNTAIRSFISAPIDQQPFANMSIYKKNKKELQNLLREDAAEAIDFNSTRDDDDLDDKSGRNLDDKLEQVLRNLGRIHADIDTVLTRKKDKGKSKAIKRVPSRLSTPEQFPSPHQMFRYEILVLEFSASLIQCQGRQGEEGKRFKYSSSRFLPRKQRWGWAESGISVFSSVGLVPSRHLIPRSSF